MARDDWLIAYRGYTDAELDAEITRLKAQDTAFSSQNAGSKGFTRDMSQFSDRLTAALEIRRERGHATEGSFRAGTTDFSGVDVN